MHQRGQDHRHHKTGKLKTEKVVKLSDFVGIPHRGKNGGIYKMPSREKLEKLFGQRVISRIHTFILDHLGWDRRREYVEALANL